MVTDVSVWELVATYISLFKGKELFGVGKDCEEARMEGVGIGKLGWTGKGVRKLEWMGEGVVKLEWMGA